MDDEEVEKAMVVLVMQAVHSTEQPLEVTAIAKRDGMLRTMIGREWMVDGYSRPIH